MVRPPMQETREFPFSTLPVVLPRAKRGCGHESTAQLLHPRKHYIEEPPRASQNAEAAFSFQDC